MEPPCNGRDVPVTTSEDAGRWPRSPVCGVGVATDRRRVQQLGWGPEVGESMADKPVEVDGELSEEEFEVDPSAEDVEIAAVETTENADVDTQDPEAREATDDA